MSAPAMVGVEGGEVGAAAAPYILELFVSGTTAKSMQAVVNVERICTQYLAGRVKLSVIDIYQDPQRAREAQIIAVPTLIRQAPLPVRRAVGAMSDDAKVLQMLDLSLNSVV